LCDRFGLTPAFLSGHINLVADSGHRHLRASADRACRTTYTQHLYPILENLATPLKIILGKSLKKN